MDMLSNDLNIITEGLASLDTKEGLSFAGKGLKLESESDAKPVVDAIIACKNLQYLNLEGNTLSVNAAKAIAKALTYHNEFKRAHWKDMFTGRMKDEIPQALRFLGSGLTSANARLVELDLSDNAFGPIGMEGLVSILKSPCCFALQELKLNNNGLGITGAKLLSKALMETYELSKKEQIRLNLRVFIAGRNRLENEGAMALAEVFKKVDTLEELIIPQNGIYHEGINKLCLALKSNTNLKVLNLNDNTVGPKGCLELASVLPKLGCLTVLNLGDCLIKSKGALILAKGLQESSLCLQELVLDFNEINSEGGLDIVKSLQNKHELNILKLGGNNFKRNGRNSIIKELEKMGLLKSLVDFNEDSDDDDEEEEENNDEDSEDESSSEDCEEDNNSCIDKNVSDCISFAAKNNTLATVIPILENITAADFLLFPTPERFHSLQNDKSESIISELKVQSKENYLESLVSAIMKVSSLRSCNIKEIKDSALLCSNKLYEEVFHWAKTTSISSCLVTNCILVHLGLIKSEDRKWKIPYFQDQCTEVIRNAMNQNYFPKECQDTINFFLDKKCNPTKTITIS